MNLDMANRWPLIMIGGSLTRALMVLKIVDLAIKETDDDAAADHVVKILDLYRTSEELEMDIQLITALKTALSMIQQTESDQPSDEERAH